MEIVFKPSALKDLKSINTKDAVKIVAKIEDMENMFLDSKFSGNLSLWKPYGVKKMEKMFSGCPAPKPYWTKFENEVNPGRAMQAYDLYTKLNNIANKNNSIKKSKI